MFVFESNIPVGLGDIIYIKSQLDSVKHRFSEIRIKFHDHLVEIYRDNDPEYKKFLNDIGNLFFSKRPYVLGGDVNFPYRSQLKIASDYGIPPKKPNLKSLLCLGQPLAVRPYIILTTKIRYLSRTTFNHLAPEFWGVIRDLAQKYKIVVLGEREVQMNQEYQHHTSEHIYGIYDDIVNNVPKEALVDLTIPALGLTSPVLSKIQQDCLIMSDAQFVITLGVGGNFCMATAVANVIGYRTDDEEIADAVFSRFYDDAKITKNWHEFISLLKAS